jgi:hypothetical protein
MVICFILYLVIFGAMAVAPLICDSSDLDSVVRFPASKDA